jgi:hypothetical protein
VGIWDLKSGKLLLRDRIAAGAEFVPIGRSHVASEKSLAAQQRQVNNCGVAADLRDRVAKAQGAPSEPVAPQGSPVAPTGSVPAASGK